MIIKTISRGSNDVTKVQISFYRGADRRTKETEGIYI
jgi:hypothetical protein